MGGSESGEATGLPVIIGVSFYGKESVTAKGVGGTRCWELLNDLTSWKIVYIADEVVKTPVMSLSGGTTGCVTQCYRLYSLVLMLSRWWEYCLPRQTAN